MKRILCFFLGILLFSISGCGMKNAEQSSAQSLEEENIQLTEQDSEPESASIQYIEGNPYFPVFGDAKKTYKGIFTFNGSFDEKNVSIKYKYLGKFQNGTLYQLTFDQIKGERIPKVSCNIGYFFIEKEKIY